MIDRRGFACVLLGITLAVMASASQVRADEAFDPLASKDLSGWQLKGTPEQSFWTVGEAVADPNRPEQIEVRPGGSDLVNAKAHGVDIFTKRNFADARIEMEVMVPRGSNSGIYLMGEYEIQVLDSFGRTELGMGDMGAIYSFAKPVKNASAKPGTWQKYEIEYRAPRFDAQGQKTASARVLRIRLNGEVIQENVEMTNVTPGGVTGKERAEGPLMLQGNHGVVAYRNIRISRLAERDAARP